jgi:hypothetical protein
MYCTILSQVVFELLNTVFQVMAVMSMWTRLQPLYAANMWNEALNKRLGTEVCKLLFTVSCFVW